MPYEFNPNWMTDAPSQPENPSVIPPEQLQALPPMPQEQAPMAAPATLNANGIPTMGTPGTQTTQFQGEAQPTTRYVPHVAPQSLPWWIKQYNQIRQDQQQQAEIQAQVSQMMDGIQPRSNEEAMRAIEMAQRLEGQIGYASDIKAGVPVPQAIAKWGAKMSPQTVNAMASIEKLKANPLMSPSGPITAHPISTPEGNVIGYSAAGPRGQMFTKFNQPEKTISPDSRARNYMQQITQIDKRLDSTPRSERAPLIEQRKKLQDAIDELMKPKSRPKVGDVVNGHVFLGGAPAAPASWKEEE
jgi:hypothetical protein